MYKQLSLSDIQDELRQVMTKKSSLRRLIELFLARVVNLITSH